MYNTIGSIIMASDAPVFTKRLHDMRFTDFFILSQNKVLNYTNITV